MRKVLITLSGAGIIASLILSSCVIKKTDDEGDSGSGGSLLNIGGSSSIINTSTGATSSGGSGAIGQGGGATTEAAACPNLLETLNPGDAGVCSMSKVAANFAQINMLIVLDKSASMTQTPIGDTKTKWVGARDAIAAALKKDETLVKYGLMMFPYSANGADDSCGGDETVNVPVGPASETVDAINATVAGTQPSGGTPTASALTAALNYYTTGVGATLEGSKYVLLVTDGGPNCHAGSAITCGPDTCTANMDKISSCGNGVDNCCDVINTISGRPDPRSLCLDDGVVMQQIQALLSQNIRTFVVGIPGTEVYAPYLNAFAEAGGTAVAGADGSAKYYAVTDSKSLSTAFTNITTSLVRSCIVPLEKAPQDKKNINIAIDCTPVPQSNLDGSPNWHYDETNGPAIIIEGPRCTLIETKGVDRVDVVNGCPPIGLI